MARPAEPSRLTGRALGVGIGAGAAGLAVLWTAQVAVAPPSAPSDVLAAGARLAGLGAGYGLLVMVLLAARIPAVERGVGADRVARWHGRTGGAVLLLLSGHAVLATCARAVHGDVPRALGDLLAHPAIAAAAFGTLLLFAAAAAALYAVRTRVRRSLWRSAHLLAYPGVALGFFHQPKGPDVGAHSGLVVLWTLLHAQVAVLVAWYRVAAPLRHAFRHGLRVRDVRWERPDVVSIVVTGRDLHLLQAEPGQYLRWRFLARGLWWSALPFSLSAPPRDGALRITVRVAGRRTARVARLSPGVRIIAGGPFGTMTARRRTRRRVLLLAGGIGVAPLRTLFETLAGGPGDITLVYRATSADDLVLRGELEHIAARRRANLHYLLSPPGRPGTERSDPLTSERLRALAPKLHRSDVYVCGSPGMTAGAVRALTGAGVPRHRIHTESLAP
ncbi:MULTISPECIES: ferric reductase-like transmembrane domain-containing protein [Actinomadura]|uniref:Ferric reductase-like transmembrane domain-containing protein n=1 Tax=Actinomadura yumaensis TaxID=111807 RepID=A0ABW2CG31_9ACTN|nr:ferric reductase-like transmembrane domain-containing protein [Actinomadura sp. J1-007]